MSRKALSSPRLLAVKCSDDKPADETTKTDKEKAPRQDGDLARGAIKGWSRYSRMRLSRLLASVSTPDYIYHVTVTYGRDWPDGETIKKHLRAFSKCLVRAGFYGFWIKHYQRRGAPHFHCLIWNAEHTDCSDIAEDWRRITGNESEHAVDVRVGDEGKAGWYLAMHSLKEHQRPDDVEDGRWWGYFDRARVQEHIVCYDVADGLTAKEIVWLKRLYRRSTGCRTFGGSVDHPYDMGRQGLSWFLPEAEHKRVLLWVHRQCALASKLDENPF